MHTSKDIPPQLATRPRSSIGLPIPFVNVINPDGSPNFRLVDPRRSYEAAANRLCALCGFELGYWIAFLGGPGSIRSRLFVDGPAHEDCLAAATTLCPYLRRRNVRRRGAEGTEPSGFDPKKPTRFMIGITRGYRTILDDNGAVVHRAASFKRIRRFTYKDNDLMEAE
jgi:hypothetical protein